MTYRGIIFPTKLVVIKVAYAKAINVHVHLMYHQRMMFIQ